MRRRELLAAMLCACVPGPAAAQSARDLLLEAAFTPSDKPTALAGVKRAIAAAETVLARDPGDREARLQRAVAIGYRGRLNRSRSDLLEARRGFEAAISADPKNAEAYLALAGWHLGAVIEMGSLLARTMLGAREGRGLKLLDKALAFGGNRAFFPALAALHRILLDPSDVAGAKRLAEAAVSGPTPTPADRILKRQAMALLAVLRTGDGKAAATKARLLLPFGQTK